MGSCRAANYFVLSFKYNLTFHKQGMVTASGMSMSMLHKQHVYCFLFTVYSHVVCQIRDLIRRLNSTLWQNRQTSVLSQACLAIVHPPPHKQSELVSVAFLMSARIVLDGQSAVTLAPDDASLMGGQGTWWWGVNRVVMLLKWTCW